MRGYAGNDVYIVDDAGDIADEAFGGGGGIDLIRSGLDTDLNETTRFLGAIENVTLLAGALAATGNDLSNALSGNTTRNVLNGKLGASDKLRFIGG